MKVKSFGLIEAIIATAILLLFITGIFYLSAQSAKIYSKTTKQENANLIARDFFDRIEILRDSGRLTFSDSSSSGQISVSCFESEKASDCLSALPSDTELELYPFKTLFANGKDGYWLIKPEAFKNIDLSNYKIKSTIKDLSSLEKEVKIEVKYEFNGRTETYNLGQIITDHL